jgi:hypothetical protein
VKNIAKTIVFTILACSLFLNTASAQCPGDPTSGNPTTRQLVLSLGQSVPSTAGDAMLRMAAAIQAQGHSTSVMDNNGPSDHKIWIDGEAWTIRSSDPVRCPVVVWSPYLQAGYDGSGYSICGIPNSAHLGCPSWFSVPQPQPVYVPPAPQPAPLPSQPIVISPAPAPLNLQLTPELAATLNAILALEKDTNDQVTSMNRTVGQTLGAAMTFVSKYIAPAIGAYLLAKKVG